ncbi:MAG: prolipoprotein diacylglyceryl transferase [Chloracidobacterium sp.]|nr:prolipoprotein diacylglyceryl transferase [Chloracidobacterium sp.]
MSVELFLTILAALFAALFAWAFRALPQERWQFLAVMPVGKNTAGEWQGLNLTYYGFFQATSNGLGAVIGFALLGAIGIQASAVFALIFMMFALGWPAARIIARVVEKKAHTFTVGGAVFAGALMAPWIIQLLNATRARALGGEIPLVPSLAALSVAYAYGEALGRLACISFGCCYGKSLDQLSPRMRRLFKSFSFTFAGATKKVAYEGRLEGAPVAPIQAITAVVFTIIALAGAYLFLKSYFTASLLFTSVGAQLWRFLSEKLRADHRGAAQKISAYQVMALLMGPYAFAVVLLFPNGWTGAPELAAGLGLLWNPAVLLFCQALWLVIFFITGRSMVTGSRLSFFVHADRI